MCVTGSSTWSAPVGTAVARSTCRHCPRRRRRGGCSRSARHGNRGVVIVRSGRSARGSGCGARARRRRCRAVHQRGRHRLPLRPRFHPRCATLVRPAASSASPRRSTSWACSANPARTRRQLVRVKRPDHGRAHARRAGGAWVTPCAPRPRPRRPRRAHDDHHVDGSRARERTDPHMGARSSRPRARRSRSPDELRGADPATNAAIAGGARRRDRAPRDVVLLNARAALVAAGSAMAVAEGMAQAARSIDSGNATSALRAPRGSLERRRGRRRVRSAQWVNLSC